MRNLLIDSPLSGTAIELAKVNDKIFSDGTTTFEFGGGKWKFKSAGKIILNR